MAARGALSGTGARGRIAVLCAAVVATLLLPDARAQATGRPAPDPVRPVVSAFDVPGSLAVVLAPVLPDVTELTPRAAEAGIARAVAGWRGNDLADRPLPTASMVKLFLAADLLHRSRAGEITLTSRDQALMQRMISASDDPAASRLWVRFDGRRAVRDVADRYGLTTTAPPQVPGQWGETVTTATDLARFLTRLPVVAHPADAEQLLTWMREATPTAADGFDQRFGAFGTLPGRPAVKQGWMCCVSGQRHLHSVAVHEGRVVVLLSEVPRSTGYPAAREALTAAAAAVPAPRTRC